MDNVAIVVDDLEAAVAFFVELGLEVQGRTEIEGLWADRVVGLDGLRSEIVVLGGPEGGTRLELTRYQWPSVIAAQPAAPNTLGLHRIMFAVDDVDDTLRRLSRHGADLLDSVVNYEDTYRLCYVRGPAGIIVALAQDVS